MARSRWQQRGVCSIAATIIAAVAVARGSAAKDSGGQEPLDHGKLMDQTDTDYLRDACPEYQDYASVPHPPFSKGPLALPYQRPSPRCRTFHSQAVEDVIKDITSRMEDPDLARLFENAFPNTLDTTISWHRSKPAKSKSKKKPKEPVWEGLQSFIVTGDITAEWLRDSTNQLQGYQALASKDADISNLILGAINTQAEYVIGSPYCNAFQPPPPSDLSPSSNGQGDYVHPAYEPNFVFECKYELDSLAHFLRLSNEFHKHTQSTDFVTSRWLQAIRTVLKVIAEQSKPTFYGEDGGLQGNEYLFQRVTNTGTETLNLQGLGNPIGEGTGLVRSAFRPSDDATILPLFIPANAMMAVELKRLATILEKAGEGKLAKQVAKQGQTIEDGVREHGVVNHKVYGEVFAFEVDGYGSHILMDDANLPSLLSLPFLGFCDMDDPIYVNTRKMILQKGGNPYYLTGSAISGIGGPHIGLEYAWPMSVLVRAMTSDDDDEIMASLKTVKRVSKLGLIHESINVEDKSDYTRSWFAWANSVFAQTILDIANRKPHLIFGDEFEGTLLQDHI